MKVVKNFPASAADRIGNAARLAFNKIREQVNHDFENQPEADRLLIDMQIDTDGDPPPTYTYEATFSSKMNVTMTYSFLMWIIRTVVRLDYSSVRWVKWNAAYGLLIVPEDNSWQQVKPQVLYLFGDGPRPGYAPAKPDDFDDGE